MGNNSSKECIGNTQGPHKCNCRYTKPSDGNESRLRKPGWEHPRHGTMAAAANKLMLTKTQKLRIEQARHMFQLRNLSSNKEKKEKLKNLKNCNQLKGGNKKKGTHRRGTNSGGNKTVQKQKRTNEGVH